MIAFAPYHFYYGDYLIGTADIVALVFSIIALAYLSRTERGIVIYWMGSLVFVLICIITLFLGRKEISYFLWAFLPPAVVFSILGKRAGVRPAEIADKF